MKFEGSSVAGVETCIEVPALRLVLDMGRCTRSAVQYPLVLLSHGHLDHMGAVAQHAARRAMMHMGESTYVAPASIARELEEFFNAAGHLDGQVIPRRVVPLSPGEEFPIAKQRWVRPFQTYHRVPSQGYTIWERRHRLRAEFQGLPGARLAELRQRGVIIEETHEVALLSFTGDTRIEVLERTPELQSSETLVMETTFLDERVNVERARSTGHIHLDEVLQRVELLPRSEVVMSHFSARYRDDEVRGIVQRKLPDELQGIVRLFGID
ncbi:MAG TPA: MBL fold metallo-hydrolase [Polyangiaceae bacterium]|nr:MBL fold metallo-hydrolase [Polyangiaceae bacterium]HYQ29607.1 MBL fold metallo-hydrolase [Polyangiaceae bacterium]